MGEVLSLSRGTDISTIQAAAPIRKELLDKISQSILDYMTKKLGAGEEIRYPNDIAGWTLENIDMMRSDMKNVPSRGAIIDGEFTRIWWLIKDCM